MFQLKLETIIRPIKIHTEETVTTTVTTTVTIQAKTCNQLVHLTSIKGVN
jgi:hypothetical protein